MECHRGRNMMYLGEGPWLCWRAGPVVMEGQAGRMDEDRSRPCRHHPAHPGSLAGTVPRIMLGTCMLSSNADWRSLRPGTVPDLG